jgi:Holliday junction DNA helicase RuvA
MYDFIEGNVEERSPTQIVLRAGPIGYRFTVPLSTSDTIPSQGVVRLYTHQLIREERIYLFGFASQTEREIFLLLNAVSGIGPQMALKVLSGLSPADFVGAVTNGRTEVLTRVKGIGPKMADRMVFELRESALGLSCKLDLGSEPHEKLVLSDAMLALVKLGFSNADAQKAVGVARKALDGEITCEALIRRALG